MRDHSRAIIITVFLIPLLFIAVFFLPISRYLQGYMGAGEWSVGE